MSKYRYIFFVLSLLAAGVVFTSSAQTNLIVNGGFLSDSGWNELGLYNNGAAKKLVQDSAYIITITQPGSERWSVQLTQSHINLKHGNAYLLTFEASASLERTLEVTISRNGGDYISYSGKVVETISPAKKKVSLRFIMKQPSDNEARLEINCGKEGGTIALHSVSLVQFTEKVLDCESPTRDELLPLGKPYPISWSAVNLAGHLTIDLSTDNGTTWTTIDTVAVDSSPYRWTPKNQNGPWCRIRIASIDTPQISSLNDGPFEIAPVRELVRNGSFTDSSNGWYLGQNGGSAEAAVTSYGGYKVTILEKGSADWNIQVTQDRIPLITGQRYRCSFLALAESPTTIDVNIGMNHDPYSSYLDSAQRYIALTTTPTRYSYVFKMNAPTDSSARFELNCGKASGVLFFDDISIVPEYTVPVVFCTKGVRPLAGTSGGRPQLYCVGLLMERRNSIGIPVRIVDLAGRTLARTNRGEHSFARRNAAGIYIVDQLNVAGSSQHR